MKFNIKNRRAKVHGEAEERLRYSREGSKIGHGEFTVALRQRNALRPSPLSDKTKSILTDTIKKPRGKAALPGVIGL